MMLFKLLSGMDKFRFESLVISLKDKGGLGDKLETLGVPVHGLGLPEEKFAIWKLFKLVRNYQPDIIQGWMYHGNIAALVAGFVAWKHAQVIWNVRHSLYNIKLEKWSTSQLIRISALLSSTPMNIIYNSKIGAEQHEAFGFSPKRSIVIPNGFDCTLFNASADARQSIRRELSLPEDTILIGMVSRYHPMKDHSNFLHAAGILVKKHAQVHFLLAGRFVDESNPEISALIRQHRLSESSHLLGERMDMSRIMAGLDVVCSSSYFGESFPNVIGEAMASCVPCVATDIGDSAFIIGDTGIIIPARNADALAHALDTLIAAGCETRIRLGKAARQRILRNFSLDGVVNDYETLYERALRTR